MKKIIGKPFTAVKYLNLREKLRLKISLILFTKIMFDKFKENSDIFVDCSLLQNTARHHQIELLLYLE